MESSPSVGHGGLCRVMAAWPGGESLVDSMQSCFPPAGVTSAQACPPQAGGQPLSEAGHFQSTRDSCVSHHT